MGPSSNAGDESDPKETREQAREGNTHTCTPTCAHIHTHTMVITAATQPLKCSYGTAYKGDFCFFFLLSVCSAESELTAVSMMEEMSLLRETVEQNRAAEASGFIETSFIHKEPPESNVRNVHTLKPKQSLQTYYYTLCRVQVFLSNSITSGFLT